MPAATPGNGGDCRRWFQPMHLSRIGGEQDRTLLAVERKSRQRTERRRRVADDFGCKRERGVCGGRRRDRRGQSQETS